MKSRKRGLVADRTADVIARKQRQPLGDRAGYVVAGALCDFVLPFHAFAFAGGLVVSSSLVSGFGFAGLFSLAAYRSLVARA